MIYKTSKLGQADLVSALHEMSARTSDEKGVCLSVCSSVKRVYCDRKTRFLYHTKDHLA